MSYETQMAALAAEFNPNHVGGNLGPTLTIDMAQTTRPEVRYKLSLGLPEGRRAYATGVSFDEVLAAVREFASQGGSA